MIVLISNEQISQGFLLFLKKPIAETFNQAVEIRDNLKLEKEAWNTQRRQYNADFVLDKLETPPPGDRNLAIFDQDIYAFGLNFVFGEADARTGKALISIKRLRPEFYNLPSQEILFKARILKEAVHELGHTYGLRHCPNPHCVMHFSNYIRDTDIKAEKFCITCRRRLDQRLLSEINAGIR